MVRGPAVATDGRSDRFFIGLNAWLSLAATTGTTGLLIAANVIYLKATTDPKKPLILFEFRGVKWYAMFFVYLFGVYVIVRSAYLVIRRATSVARREHVPGVDTKSLTLRGAWDNKRVRRVVEEFGIAVALVLGALLASHWTTKALKTEPLSGRNIRDIVVAVVVAYTIGRLAYCVIVPRYAAKVRVRPSTEEPEDAIQPKYSGGRLMATSYNVVLFAILAAVFSEWLTQGALPTNLQSGLSLFIGGLYPAGILLGLSYSVPAAPGIKLPEWKTLRGLRLLP